MVPPMTVLTTRPTTNAIMIEIWAPRMVSAK